MLLLFQTRTFINLFGDLSNVLLECDVQRRAQKFNKKVRSFALNPRHIPGLLADMVAAIVSIQISKSVQKGCVLWLCEMETQILILTSAKKVIQT